MNRHQNSITQTLKTTTPKIFHFQFKFTHKDIMPTSQQFGTAIHTNLPELFFLYAGFNFSNIL